MTLIAAIVVGLLAGYMDGFNQRAGMIFVAIWAVVLVVQTALVLDAKDVPPEAWSYVPVQIVIFAIGIAMLWLGSRLRVKLPPSISASKSD